MKTPLMRLLHIVKMIFNVSTFYNTPERVASLLVKITNQVSFNHTPERATTIQFLKKVVFVLKTKRKCSVKKTSIFGLFPGKNDHFQAQNWVSALGILFLFIQRRYTVPGTCFPGDSQLQEIHHGERADNHLEPGEGCHRGQAHRVRQTQ